MMFVTPGAAVPFLKAGQLRAIAVTSHKRSRFLPDVPTVTELGYPSVEETGWFGLFAPAGTPVDVVQTLRTQLREAVAKPQNKAKLEALYLETAPDAATRDFPAFVQAEFGKWEKQIQSLGVTME
jgi:tripartite-type tricarboxylate transporter receptor subunit TctC